MNQCADIKSIVCLYNYVAMLHKREQMIMEKSIPKLNCHEVMPLK